MDNKYYTPEIEEIHKGFELEANVRISSSKDKHIDKWIKIIVGDGSKYDQLLTGDMHHRNSFDINILRVKHLNREDIESLEFEVDKKSLKSYTEYFKYIEHGSSIFISHSHGDNTFSISLRKEGMLVSEVSNISIKNKSEFKRILKQIEI